MSWNPICTNPTKAARRYTQRIIAVMLFYVLAVFRVTAFVRAHHPTGTKLYFLSALPAIPILALLAVVGLYLREEIDEFKRQQLVVAMLCGIGVTLAVSAVADFLRTYGAITALPPFTEFLIFWFTIGIVGGIQGIRNRVTGDE